MSACDICDKLAEMDAKLSILLTGVGALLAAAGVGDYWNPLDKAASVTLTNGSRTAEGDGSFQSVRSVTSHAADKYYAEFEFSTMTADTNVGCANGSFDVDTQMGSDTTNFAYYTDDGHIYYNAGDTAYGAALAAGEILGIAIDITNQLVYFAIDNVWQNSADPVAGTGGYAFSPAGALFLSASPGTVGVTTTLRTVGADFSYTPPTGFSAWG